MIPFPRSMPTYQSTNSVGVTLPSIGPTHLAKHRIQNVADLGPEGEFFDLLLRNLLARVEPPPDRVDACEQLRVALAGSPRGARSAAKR